MGMLKRTPLESSLARDVFQQVVNVLGFPVGNID
jgi:hypothetical protein